MLGLRDKRNKKGRKAMLATIKLKEKTRNWCLECYTLCSRDEVVIKNANNSERERKQTNKQRKSWQYHWRERQRRNRENKTQTQKEKNRERGGGIIRKSDLTGRRRRVRRSCLGNLATWKGRRLYAPSDNSHVGEEHERKSVRPENRREVKFAHNILLR